MLNTICLQGRLTADPELKTAKNGVEVATFTLACEENRKVGDSKPVNFIDCEVWGKTASMVHQYFSKGQMMTCSGMLKIRTFKTKEGKNGKSFVIICENVNFCGSKADNKPSAPAQASVQTPSSSSYPDFESLGYNGDLPF